MNDNDEAGSDVASAVAEDKIALLSVPNIAVVPKEGIAELSRLGPMLDSMERL